MDAPTSRRQLLQALPELFPGKDHTAFRGDAAETIYQRPEDWAAGLLGLPVGDRKAAITAAVWGGTSAGLSSESLTKWAKQLVHLKEEDGCLQLPAGLSLMLPPRLRTSLYVRPCYRQLFDLVQQRCSQAAEPLGFIVTGTPGIGVSAAALYLIRRLGQQQQVVCYDYLDDLGGRVRLQFDFQGGVVKAAQVTSLPDPGADGRNIWHIIEGSPPPVEFGGKYKTVVLSSIENSNFKRFLKGCGSQDPLYLPVWSLEELEACRARLHPEVAADAMLTSFTWFGGSIRHVLAMPTERPEDQLKPDLGEDSVSSLVRAISDPDVYKAYLNSYSLGHFKVTPDFRVRCVWFASPHAARLVLQELETDGRSDLREFPVALRDHPRAAGLRGALFEQYGHNLFLHGGVSCTMRQLRPSRRRPHGSNATEYEEANMLHQVEEETDSHHEIMGGGQQQQQQQQQWQQAPVEQQAQQSSVASSRYPLPRGLTLKWDGPGLQGEGVLGLLDHVYLRPRTSNNAAWDAVLCCSQPLMLQFTASSQHGVLAQPVQELLARLGPERSRAVRLVFVVPPKNFDRFAWQPWLAKRIDDERKWVPEPLQSLEQWVMALDGQPRSNRSNGAHAPATAH